MTIARPARTDSPFSDVANAVGWAGSAGPGAVETFHHQPSAAARDVSDHGRAPMQFRDRAEIDRKRQHHLLPLAQSEIGGLDEHAGRAQVDGLAQFPPATWDADKDDGSGAMARMQPTFHVVPRAVLEGLPTTDRNHYACNEAPRHAIELSLRRPQTQRRSPGHSAGEKRADDPTEALDIDEKRIVPFNAGQGRELGRGAAGLEGMGEGLLFGYREQ